ncbi:MAG: DUF1345 domain-containing protein [Ferruginibacter sp.]|nr:DUF1345 domain-containing protein [Ferruginibacter sp.]
MTGKKNGNTLLYLRPLQRVLLSLFVSLVAFASLYRQELEPLLFTSILWVAFALTFIISSAVVFFKLPVSEIARRANEEDGSRLFVLVVIVLTSLASMFTVLLLIRSGKMEAHRTLTEIMAVMGMMVSWTLVHTMFTFHYAHMFYSNPGDDTAGEKPLSFPGSKKPDYIDFAYFAFVIGMTFQVSDVEITSPLVRRTALAHGLLSFAFNTFIVALTINLIAGIR